MQIQIENPSVPSIAPAEWRSLAESRVRFVMRRLRDEIKFVHVRLVDVNGPRGGVDQMCQLQLETSAFGKVVVSAVQANAPAALNAALRRAARALVRQWQRNRRPARPMVRQDPSLWQASAQAA
ncbi:MAG: HPF/RaiA family ribosome-associated protein [Hydrogenophaga sp.]